MNIKNFFKHIALVIRHRHKVFIHCAKCKIPFRGLVHDLSKFSPQELFESVRHFQGNRSPIGACRRATGVSYAWLHHKGRNKHHIEYWTDPDCKIQPLIPYKYAVECVCDKLAATKTYAGKDYNEGLALFHWQKYGCKVDGNPQSMEFFEKVFTDLKEHGEKHILNKSYMKKTYNEICEVKRMTISKMQKELGLEALPEFWSEIFDDISRNHRTLAYELLGAENVRKIIEKYNILTPYKDEVISAANELLWDEAASLYLCLVDRTMQLGRTSDAPVKSIRAGTLGGRYAFIFPHLKNVPKSAEFLRSRGLSDEMISGTLYEFDRAVEVHKGRTGENGILISSYSWLQLIYKNNLVRIGNLNYQMCGFAGPVKVFKNSEGEIRMLADGYKVHKSGRPLGAALCQDDDGAFEASFTETDSEYIGHPLDETGDTLRESVSLPKKEWTLVLERYDPVLAVHIPTGISLSEELCEESYRLARETFARSFPEYKFKAFSCVSWMMSRDLIHLSREGSNLVKFLKKYTPFKLRAPGSGVFTFVYKLSPSIDISTLDYSTLPEETSLQRSIKKHYLNGGRIYEDGGIFF